MWNILKDFEAFKFVFKEVETFVQRLEAFIKIMRLFEKIYREMEAFA
jgi:hypothetical protein